jgi:hypothetical protein
MSRDSERKTTDGLGAAPRAFLRLSAGEAALEGGEVSRGRKLAALGFSVLVLIAVPLLWVTSGADQAVAVAGKSAPGHGHDGDDDDNSGPGGDTAGDDDDLTDSRTSADGATSTRASGRATNTGTGRGDTRNSTRGGTTGTNTGTTRGDRETGGTTLGGTSVQETRTTHRGHDTRGTTRGPTNGTNTGTGRAAVRATGRPLFVAAQLPGQVNDPEWSGAKRPSGREAENFTRLCETPPRRAEEGGRLGDRSPPASRLRSNAPGAPWQLSLPRCTHERRQAHWGCPGRVRSRPLRRPPADRAQREPPDSRARLSHARVDAKRPPGEASDPTASIEHMFALSTEFMVSALGALPGCRGSAEPL